MAIILPLSQKTFAKHLKGIHEFENPKQAILNAAVIFTGGGPPLK